MNSRRKMAIIRRKIELIQQELERRREKDAKRKRARLSVIDVSRLPKDLGLRKCADVLKSVCCQPKANIFLEPVNWKDQGLTNYTTIVKQPIDFSIIRTKIVNNEYWDPLQFRDDLMLVFKNCKLYNPKPNAHWFQADAMENFSEAEYERIVGVHENKFVRRMRKVLDVVYREKVDSRYFLKPVSLKEAPDYSLKIKNAMDFRTIREKLLTYETPAQFQHDVNLVWNNAYLYNPTGHIIHTAARRLQDQTNAALKQQFPELFEEEDALSTGIYETYNISAISPSIQEEIINSMEQLDENRYGTATNIIKEDLFGKDSDMKDMDDEVALDQLSDQCVRKLLTYLRQALKMQNEETRDFDSNKSKSEISVEQSSSQHESVSELPIAETQKWQAQSCLSTNTYQEASHIETGATEPLLIPQQETVQPSSEKVENNERISQNFSISEELHLAADRQVAQPISTPSEKATTLQQQQMPVSQPPVPTESKSSEATAPQSLSVPITEQAVMPSAEVIPTTQPSDTPAAAQQQPKAQQSEPPETQQSRQTLPAQASSQPSQTEPEAQPSPTQPSSAPPAQAPTPGEHTQTPPQQSCSEPQEDEKKSIEKTDGTTTHKVDKAPNRTTEHDLKVTSTEKVDGSDEQKQVQQKPIGTSVLQPVQEKAGNEAKTISETVSKQERKEALNVPKDKPTDLNKPKASGIEQLDQVLSG